MNRTPHTCFEIGETIQMLHGADLSRYHEIQYLEALDSTYQ